MPNFLTVHEWTSPELDILNSHAPSAEFHLLGSFEYRSSTVDDRYDNLLDANLGHPPLWPVASLPWDRSVYGIKTRLREAPEEPPDSPPDPLAEAQAHLAAKQARLSTIQAPLPGLRAALATAAEQLRVGQDRYDEYPPQIYKANIRLQRAIRLELPDEIAAAEQALQTIRENQESEGFALEALALTHYQAQQALGLAELPLAGAIEDVQNAQEGVVQITFLQSFPSPPYGDPSTIVNDYDGDIHGEGSSDLRIYGEAAYNDKGCFTGFRSTVRWSEAEYRILVRISDELWKAATSGNRLALEVKWSEVSLHRRYKTVMYPGGGGDCPDVPVQESDGHTKSHVPRQTIIRLDSAPIKPIDGYGRRTLASSGFLLSRPGGGTSVGAGGLPVEPRTRIAQLETRSAIRERQGWCEHTVSDGSGPQPRRYLTQVANTGSAAPTGVVYSGALEFVEPPDPEDPPSPDRFIRPGPLLLRDTLNLPARPVTQPYGRGQDPFNDRSVDDKVVAMTPQQERVFADPPGLVLVLQNEQTPASIQATVDGLVAEAWPPDTPFIGSHVSETKRVAAMRYVAPTGDMCVKGRCRFKLYYYADDARPERHQAPPDDFQTVHRWRFIRRNLLTGAVAITNRQQSIMWPVRRTITENGVPTVRKYFEWTDEEWTEVPVPAVDEVVFLEVLPGQNPAPYTFASGPSVKLIPLEASPAP